MGFIIHRLRTLLWTCFYRSFWFLFFSKLGRGCTFQGWIDIPQRGGSIFIGDKVCVSRFVEFTVTRGAKLQIEDGTFIGRGAVISAHNCISIEDNVLLAEYVSIHDNNHQLDNPDIPVNRQGFVSAELIIGAGSWIGAQATLVKGCGLGRRCVVGAGAVVTKSFPDSQTIVGIPARALQN